MSGDTPAADDVAPLYLCIDCFGPADEQHLFCPACWEKRLAARELKRRAA